MASPVSAATPARPQTSAELYRDHVNPQWVRLLDTLRMNVRYSRCRGAELFAEDGKRHLDLLSGYCVHNIGHNHPHVIAALESELRREGPGMLQSHVPELAGDLAAELCERAGGKLTKVFFGSSGSEGVEAAIKFARARTRRDGILYADGAFHGLTTGALSLMGNSFWREGFGRLLPDCEAIPFNDLDALRKKLETKKFAALMLEPIQAEAGIKLPEGNYLAEAKALCARYGTLLVLDEVQTGLGRTGKFLAAHHYSVEPDMVVLAKALSGGLIPVSALLMTEPIYDAVYGSLKRSMIHASTFSENALAMRAGLATLEVLDDEQLCERSAELGEYLRARLTEALAGYEMIRDIRGKGLFCGIEFAPPKRVTLRAAFEAVRAVHPGMFGQMVVMNLFERGALTQITGNNFMVLKVAPPLVVTRPQIDEFVGLIRDTVDAVHASGAFWSEALGMARRAANI
jgi:ornithine--oxo-acid transaminase